MAEKKLNENLYLSGSLIGAIGTVEAITASVAINAGTASLLLGSIVSASYALTASYAMNGGSGGGPSVSSSYASTASVAISAISASYALTAPIAISASYAGTASMANYFSASYVSGGAIFTQIITGNPDQTLNITAGSSGSVSLQDADNQASLYVLGGTTPAIVMSSPVPNAVFQIQAPLTTYIEGPLTASSIHGVQFGTPFQPTPVQISGSVTVAGAMIATNLTASLSGSGVGITGIISASYATNAGGSTIALTASYGSGSFFAQTALSASYAITASNATNAINATLAQTASYNLQSVSSSYATTASNATNAINATVATFASGANVLAYSASLAQTASYALVAQNVLGSITSASYALTASFALNGGGGSGGGTQSFVTNPPASVFTSFPFNATWGITALINPVPAALTEIDPSMRMRIDASYAASSSVSCHITASGPSGSWLAAQYSTDEVNWTSFTSLSLMNTGTSQSIYSPFPVTASTQILVRLVTTNGDNATNAELGNVALGLIQAAAVGTTVSASSATTASVTLFSTVVSGTNSAGTQLTSSYIINAGWTGGFILLDPSTSSLQVSLPTASNGLTFNVRNCGVSGVLTVVNTSNVTQSALGPGMYNTYISAPAIWFVY